MRKCQRIGAAGVRADDERAVGINDIGVGTGVGRDDAGPETGPPYRYTRWPCPVPGPLPGPGRETGLMTTMCVSVTSAPAQLVVVTASVCVPRPSVRTVAALVSPLSHRYEMGGVALAGAYAAVKVYAPGVPLLAPAMVTPDSSRHATSTWTTSVTAWVSVRRSSRRQWRPGAAPRCQRYG